MSLPSTGQLPSHGRRPELDGIRCCAVLGVMLVHFDPGQFTGPWGDWGVKVFFVLSGFLITDGLLGLRERLDAGQLRLGAALGDFFLRRILRLWPLYLTVLALTYLANWEQARELIIWNLTSTTNYAVTRQGAWPGIYSHLWTLAVEQQFYLLWPLLILAATSRLLPVVLAILISSAPLFRGLELTALAAAGASSNHPAGLLLPMCADSLAWGALLACGQRFPSGLTGRFQGTGLALPLGLFGALYAFHHFGPDRFSVPWLHAAAGTLLGLAAFRLLGHCVAPGDSLLKRLLRLPPLTYLGVISYGIYLLHNFSHRIGPALLRRVTGQNYLSSEAGHVLYLMVLSVALAVLSWHFFERPLLTLGRSRSASR